MVAALVRQKPVKVRGVEQVGNSTKATGLSFWQKFAAAAALVIISPVLIPLLPRLGSGCSGANAAEYVTESKVARVSRYALLALFAGACTIGILYGCYYAYINWNTLF